MRFTKRLGKLALAAGLLGGFVCASAAAPSVTKTTQSQSQQASNQQLLAAIKQLHSIEKTLEMADHDYGGHRAEAVHDIHAAAHQLKEAVHHGHKQQGNTGNSSSKASSTKQTGNSAAKGNSEPEPQQLSDQQLAQAIPELKQAVSTLKQANHDYGGHRERAVEDLDKAIHQLEKALEYSKEKNQTKSAQ